MPGLNGLTMAVPRGALMRETLDLLDALGVDTSEVRANDRKLLFEEAGIVTMRPSDVATYVEAGRAQAARRRARRRRPADPGGAGVIERLAVGREDAAATAAHVRGYIPAPA